MSNMPIVKGGDKVKVVKKEKRRTMGLSLADANRYNRTIVRELEDILDNDKELRERKNNQYPVMSIKERRTFIKATKMLKDILSIKKPLGVR